MPESRPRFPSAMPPRCQRCGDVLGVYEPLILISDDFPRVTSRAAEPHLFPTIEPGYHKTCYELEVPTGGLGAGPETGWSTS
jgi:hypothetical protein